MKINTQKSSLIILGLLFGLAGCLDNSGNTTKKSKLASYNKKTETPTNPSDPVTPISNTPIYNPTISLGGVITDITIESTSATTQTNVPFTLGHAFIKGNLLPNEGLAGKLSNGTVIPLQVDVKALHTDGSVRHAIISGILPTIAGVASEKIQLTKATLSGSTKTITTNDILAELITASVSLKVNGVDYKVSLEDLLANSKSTQWLKGPIANEFILSSSAKAVSGGALHPHLAVRFAIRSYAGIAKAKIDTIVENGWAYEPNQSDFTYDVQVKVNGASVYSKNALDHYNHARWHKNFWSGVAPSINIKHNTPYLISTKAVPNYDQSITVSDSALTEMKTNFDANSEPMKNGIATAYMPTTGGRPEIGLIPGWGAMLILSMDKRAKAVTLGMGDLAGSWSFHYRDRVSDDPISLIDYPYMTLYAASFDSYNPVAKRNEALPGCPNGCNNPNAGDTSHQPAFSYLPYLLTGEHYYMEELMFYGMMNVGGGNMLYREHEKGLLISEQTRAMAWSLRTFVDAAYILPDNHRMKAHFASILDSNIKWFNANYTNNKDANIFGTITHGYSLSYNNTTGLAPWQDDFFTSAVGIAVEREIPGALELLKFKAKFPVGRMTAPGTCWVLGSVYSFMVKPTSTSPYYTTWEEAYKASNSAAMTATTCASAAMASVIQAETGTPMEAGGMTGYPTSSMGYPSNMQPALAFAKDSGIPNSKTAWDIFDARKQKPDYSWAPEFAIIPRQ